MRERPYAFLRLESRWINMASVTDIEDLGETLVVYLPSDMARMVGQAPGTPVDVARRVVISDPAAVARLRTWLKLNDED